jgi:hypothetical protein
MLGVIYSRAKIGKLQWGNTHTAASLASLRVCHISCRLICSAHASTKSRPSLKRQKDIHICEQALNILLWCSQAHLQPEAGLLWTVIQLRDTLGVLPPLQLSGPQPMWSQWSVKPLRNNAHPQTNTTSHANQRYYILSDRSPFHWTSNGHSRSEARLVSPWLWLLSTATRPATLASVAAPSCLMPGYAV